MASHAALSLASLFLISLPLLLRSQQPYGGQFIADCNSQHNETSLLGYFCNGRSRSCQAYAAFSSQPPYQSVSAISTLLGADPSQVSLANSVARNATFPEDTKVLVPVNCSCSGAFYQSNASYVVKKDDTAMTIANSVYQGLSTCQAIQNLDGPSTSLQAGQGITVPVRCACPTSNQTGNDMEHLLSYLVDSGEFLDAIGERFGLTAQEIMDANEMHNTVIYPSTTLLIPLKKEPSPSQLIASPSPPPPPPTSPPPPPPGKKDHKWLYSGIGIAVGVAVVLALSLVVFYTVKANKPKTRKDAIHPNGNANAKPSWTSSGVSTDISDVLSGISELGQALKVYTLEELRLATKNFSEESRIAGSVYRGVLNGDVAAVKMVSRDVTKEIGVLKKVNHFNLVKLSGICFNQGQWFLVYEYAEKGSLHDWIFHSVDGSKVLSWVQRVQIALDVATGMNYLHSYTEPPYVHKDIKCSNILLDGRFRAKIANLAMARSAEGKEGEFTLTRHIIGTQGYMAPEYLEHGLVSPKLDVYALGVVMMEMITGTNVADAQGGGALMLNAFSAAAALAEEESWQVESLMDHSLQGNYPLELALAMARLVEWCLRKDAGSRPTMEEIARALQTIFDMSLTWESSSVAKVSDSESAPLVNQ